MRELSGVRIQRPALVGVDRAATALYTHAANLWTRHLALVVVIVKVDGEH